ncbi:MAG: oligosaccharide flippase family protein [Actinomycetota bacterium]|nr:oligosaccharide flippase family protein [Actinomycetota bacterium]
MAGAEQAGRRAARNTAIRAAGEIVGKLSTLALFAVLARELGERELGVFVFAFAFLGIALIPIGFGTDSYLLRESARERRAAGGTPSREALDGLFWDVIALKAVAALPVLLLGGGALVLLDYPAHTRLVVMVMAVGLLLDLFAKTFHAVFNAYERSDLLVLTVVGQRLLTGGVGVAALLSGQGLVTVAVIFSVGSLLHLVLGVVLLGRAIGMPHLAFTPARWRGLTMQGFPFAVQDVFIVILFKLDAVLLSVLAAESAVGRYGAAYRLLEATLFVSYALNGAFIAMYAYLTRETEPSIGAVFGRSIKSALVILAPVAVVMGVLAEDVAALVFGGELADAGGALRLLAPVVVLLSVVTLSSTLIASQRTAGAIMRISAVMVTLNVVLNVVLIPRHEDLGAAAAMLATEGIFAGVALWVAARTVGGLEWIVVLAGPVVASAAMAVVVLALRETPFLAAAAGGLLYTAVLVGWERARNPEDLAFMGRVVRRRLPARSPA